MAAFVADLRFARRSLERRRGFFAVAVTTLALGIGAGTSVFSVVDGVLFRPLSFAEPAQLVAVHQTYPDWLKQPVLAARWDMGTFSIPEFRDWRAEQASFDDVAIYSTVRALVSRRDAAPEQVSVVRASASLLPVLRVRPVLGRAFLPGEDVPGGPAVTMVSYETWRAQFGGDSSVLGTLVQIDDRAFEIVGVLPPGLSLDRSSTAPEPPYWVPTQDSSEATDRGSHSYHGVARLKPGGLADRAALETVRIVNAGSVRTPPTGVRVTPLQLEQTRAVRRPLLVLLAAAVLLLLIACVNVATLLLGEATTREHEMATRVALGASRGRLVRQLLTESLALAGIAGLLGMALAFGGTRLLVAMAPARIPGLADVRTDLRVLGVTLMATVVTALLFGLVPALTLSRSGPASLMRTGVGQSARGRGRLQRVFVALQLALSVTLLVGAGLLSRSFARLTAVDPGFEIDRVLAVRIAMPRAISRDHVVRLEYYRRALERLRALPGIAAATAAYPAPFTGGNATTTVELEAGASTPTRAVEERVITPKFFTALGIPLRTGRFFSPEDRANAPLVLIVSESMARELWPGASAIGKRVRFQRAWRTVVGVVPDIKDLTLGAGAEPTVYAPVAQRPQGLTLLVRTRGEPGAMAASVRAALAEVDRRVAVTTTQPMAALVAQSVEEERYRTTLIGLFGAVATILATVGMYGVTSRAVARRTREVAIRVALGASPASVSARIVGQTLAGVAAGFGVGVLGARATSRLLVPFLFGVSATDPWTYAGILALLGLVSVVASWIPARRTGRIAPASVLRAE
jgi:putative ABC transport system permease protein